MKIYVKHDISIACKAILREQMEKLNLPFNSVSVGEIEIAKALTGKEQELLSASLKKYGIEILDDHKITLVQKIKDTITEMVYAPETLTDTKFSEYLSKKLHHSYGYLTTLFSEISFTTIEGFIILQKTERAKELILSGEHTLTEIAYKLNYSSVTHLSNQFKKTTGLTPSAFQKIMRRRRQSDNS
jgi:AraC-like DNA-binding protein